MTFGGYRIDAVHRTVTNAQGRVVRLEPKAFDLLVYLTQHPGETMSRERLIADVWEGKFVTDDAVMVAVYALRQAFDDDARSPRFIETIRGRGYRWIASESAAVQAPRRRWVPAAIVALAASGIGAVVWNGVRPAQSMPSMTQAAKLVRANARGVFFSERTTRRDLEQARAEFRSAIGIDARFSEPHAALAQVCVRLVEINAPGAEANEAEARREVQRAMALAPQSPLSLAARATVEFVLDRDAERAARSYQRAIELDPSLPGVRRRYSYLLAARGRFAEAVQQAQAAVEMDPASSVAIADLAWAQVLAGRLDEGERLYRDALRLDPSSGGMMISLGYCLELRGDATAAMESYRSAMRSFGLPQEVIEQCDKAFSAGGLVAVHEVWLERLRPQTSTPRFLVAMHAARAGRNAEAIDLLQQAAKRREPATLWVAVHPAFASLHGQREFASVVASSFQTR